MNVISKASLYGIKAAIFLAKQPRKTFIPISKISKNINIPFHYLAKILQEMRKAEIISSSKGSKGGVYLTKTADQITVYDIVFSIEGNNNLANFRDYKLENKLDDKEIDLLLINIENDIKNVLVKKTIDNCII